MRAGHPATSNPSTYPHTTNASRTAYQSDHCYRCRCHAYSYNSPTTDIPNRLSLLRKSAFECSKNSLLLPRHGIPVVLIMVVPSTQRSACPRYPSVRRSAIMRVVLSCHLCSVQPSCVQCSAIMAAVLSHHVCSVQPSCVQCSAIMCAVFSHHVCSAQPPDDEEVESEGQREAPTLTPTLAV